MNDIFFINQFYDRLLHSDQYVRYKGVKYFFEGCCCQFDDHHQILSAEFVIYRLPEWEEVYDVVAATPAACIEKFIQEFRMDGKTIHQLIPEIEIVDADE